MVTKLSHCILQLVILSRNFQMQNMIPTSTCICYLLLLFPTKLITKETYAYSCNNQLINYVLERLQTINTIFFWSDDWFSSQFRSSYVLYSLLSYPADVKLSLDYGEAHHFKGPHDGKRKVYQDVTSLPIVITNAKHFTTYAKHVCKPDILYIDRAYITVPDVEDAVYQAHSKSIVPRWWLQQNWIFI